MKTFVSAEKAVCADEQDLSVLRAFVEDELMIRPSLGDQFRVGFFSADHSSQTDSSEIIEIKEMTNVMRILGKAFNSLRKDFLMYKNIIKGEYEENIEKHVSNLWRHINETAQSIEANHKKKLTMIRESFRQQLADAIAVIKTQYEGFYSEKINAFITSEAQNTFSMKLQTMLNKIREKELTIKSLEAQMVEHQNEALRRLMLGEEEMDTETIKEENSQYRQQIDKLQIKIIALEDAVKRKDNTIEKLDTDMVNVKKKLDKDQTTIVMLTAAYEKLTNDFTKEREAAINMNIKHKKEMEIQMALSEKQILIYQEVAVKEQKEKEILHEKYGFLQKFVLDEGATLKLEDKLEIEEGLTSQIEILKKSEAEEKGFASQFKIFKKREVDMKKLIESLKSQLDLNNRTWEKKFAILKQSLHAIKDEMFLRQTFQRQPANINRISINYAIDGPLGAVPGRKLSDVVKNHSLIPNMPLIGVQPTSEVESMELQGGSNLIDTGSDSFTGDDSQVLSGSEDFINRITFLPSPPSSARFPYRSSQQSDEL